MDEALYQLMLSWENSDDPNKINHSKYRMSFPDALAFKRIKESDLAHETPSYPSWIKMAENLIGSADRSIKAAIHGEQIFRTDEQKNACLEICHACDQYDPKRARCTVCGCKTRFKTRLAKDHCPLDPPKW